MARASPRGWPPGWASAPPTYLDNETIDREGVGRLVGIAVAEGGATRPGLKICVCGDTR
ncbi:hypothetical protein ACFT4A_21920 [Streptomyces sp. NPDC057099]|uniref:hypothetical protein n=1 Tax=Streptomyces sp. NPDC057099 TaxID=3346019 RepID=UPI0036402108